MTAEQWGSKVDHLWAAKRKEQNRDLSSSWAIREGKSTHLISRLAWFPPSVHFLETFPLSFTKEGNVIGLGKSNSIQVRKGSSEDLLCKVAQMADGSFMDAPIWRLWALIQQRWRWIWWLESLSWYLRAGPFRI